MEKETLYGKIASQPAAVTLNGVHIGVMVFILIEVDGKYHKLYYKDTIPSSTFSNILVSSVGDDVQIGVLSSYYHNAREIGTFFNITRGLSDTVRK